MFIKKGDGGYIVECYEGDEKKMCPKCGKKITTIALGQNENKFICTCELEEDNNDKNTNTIGR